MNGPPMVNASLVTTQQQRIEMTTIPTTIGAGGLGIVVTRPITVPANEMWTINTAGVSLLVNNSGIIVDGGYCRITPSSGRVQQLDQSGIANAAIQPTFVPMSPAFANVNYVQFVNAFLLQGVEVMEGDQIVFNIGLRNTNVVAVDVTQCNGAIRYRPMRLVSESQVARIQDLRQDFNLDARLRGVRG